MFAFTRWNCIKCNSLLNDACLVLFIYDIQFHTFFWKPGNRNRSQGRMRPSDPFASSFPGFSFSSSFGFGNGFGSDPFGSNRYRKCFPDFWHHCNFTSRKYSGQKRINPMSNFAPSVEHCIVLNLNFYLKVWHF